MNMLRYRPEIDGLRAVAIAPVVLYHAGLSAVSGGYVGVDVFFVISGFLITSLLLQDLRAGEFSLVKFYERRCRRIVPPLVVMALAVSAAAWRVRLLPLDFVNFGRSLAAMASLWANVFFYKGSGYFDAESWAKPLLHTWSLSVEEQFYLVFPLLLAFLWKKGRTRLPLLLGLLAAVSLGLSAVRMSRDPEGVFYLLQFRAWELLLGAAVAALPDVRFHGGGIGAGLGSLLGLGLILVPAVTYDSHTMFPGPGALPPCLGTVLLIFIHGPGYSVSPVGRLLASRPFTGLGKISYSLYLWHWPLLVLPRYVQGRPLAGTESLAWVSLAVVLSILSWRLVERPVRERRVLPRRRPLFAVTLAALAVLALSGRMIRYHDGFPERLPPHARLFAEAAGDQRQEASGNGISEPKLTALNRENPELYTVSRIGAPGSWPPDFLLLGNSHALHWTPAFDALARQYGVSGVLFLVWPLPLLGTWDTCQKHPDRRPGGQFTSRAMEFIQQENIKNVMIAGYYHDKIGYNIHRNDQPHPRWQTQPTGCLSDDGSPKTIQEAQAIFDRQMQYTVQVMQSLGLTVWILEDTPDYDESVPHMLTRAAVRGSLETVGYDRIEYQKRQKPVNESLDRLTPLGVRVVKVAETICPDGPCLLFDQEGSFYRDYHHLSAHGALRFKDALRR
jgi:peptidoglycan/LPS O-acetylase OafA/YrhL